MNTLAKPACQMCAHAEPGREGGACTIYDSRPEDCRSFRCLWLISQEDDDKTPLPIELRPDHCHVVFNGLAINGEVSETSTAANVDPKHPDAWRQAPVMPFIIRLIELGVFVAVTRGKEMVAIFGELS